MFSPQVKIPEAQKSQELVRSGYADLVSGEAAAAIIKFQDALYWQKANPDAYYFLARAFVDLNDGAHALETINLAKTRFPEIFESSKNGGADFGVYPVFLINEQDPAVSILQNATLVLREKDHLVWDSHDQIVKGIACFESDDTQTAISHYLKALEINPWNVHAYYYLGQAFADSGEPEKARFIFTKAIEQFSFAFGQASRFGEYQGLGIDVKSVVAFYDAFSKRHSDLTKLLAPEKADEYRQEDLRQVYETAQQKWQSGEIKEPAFSRNFLTEDLNVLKEKSVLLVTPKHIKCSPEWDEYEISFYLVGTGEDVLSKFEHHHSDAFHTEGYQLAEPRSDDELANGVNALSDHIETMRPDVVLFEGTFMGGQHSISCEELSSLKQKFGFKLVTLVIDINPPLPNYAAYWAEVSDLVLAMNENPYLDEVRQHCPVIIYPGIPIDLKILCSDPAGERNIDALFIGARKRYRDMWCAHMMDAGIDLMMKFTVQSLEESLRFEEFADLHRRSKIVFNNGLVSSRDHALNLRIFETIAVGAVLLQQDFDQLHAYFVPYVHYAPFSNVPEMVATTKFLLANPDISEKITTAAFDWYRARYGGEHFWAKLLSALEAS